MMSRPSKPAASSKEHPVRKQAAVVREYASYLKERPEEGDKLFDDVLIPVTSFFRDFEAFEALKTQVYPAIVKDKGNKGTIRMWAPGCSTGEETYSLAMTLLEFLGASKKDLQSANEELGTFNAELGNKNNELHDLSNDILNLLNSTRIPVVMLDRRLYIRRITPAAAKLFKVLAADIGRPFADIKLNIEESDITPHDLELQITKVLDSLQPVEREVRDLEGRWHGLSILPYRTQDNKIDGVVLALQDIDAVKRSQRYLQTIIENIPTPLLVLDAELRVRFANEKFCATFQIAREETVGQLLYFLGNEQWKGSRVDRITGKSAAGAQSGTELFRHT